VTEKERTETRRQRDGERGREGEVEGQEEGERKRGGEEERDREGGRARGSERERENARKSQRRQDFCGS
jgi:hypothetical protein